VVRTLDLDVEVVVEEIVKTLLVDGKVSSSDGAYSGGKVEPGDSVLTLISEVDAGSNRVRNRVVDIIVDLITRGGEPEGSAADRAGRDRRNDVSSREIAVKLVLDTDLATDLSRGKPGRNDVKVELVGVEQVLLLGVEFDEAVDGALST